MSVRRLRETTGAPLRDLLQLGLSSGRDASSQIQPAIVLPRERATLVHLGGLKAVIGVRTALFFDADLLPVRRNVRRIAEAVRELNRPPVSVEEVEEEALPFELVVLEGVLREAVGSYHRRRRLYERVIRSTASKPTIISSEEAFIAELHRASALDGALASFEAETRGAVGVLVDLLASDEDMLGLLLSERERAKQEPQYAVDAARHGVVELLLESYHRRLVLVASELAELRSQLASSRELSRVAIDLRRNRIIRFNIYLSISSVGISTTTAVAGLFGMNLVTGLENAIGAFTIVSFASAALGAAVATVATAALDRWYARVDVSSAADDKLALSNLLTNISSLEHVFFNRSADRPQIPPPEPASPVLDRNDLAALLRAASGRAPSDRELDLVFGIFHGTGHNNTINIEQARRALQGALPGDEDPANA